MLDGEWAKAVGAEFKKPYYRDLYNFVRDEYATHVVYPPADDIFNAFHLTPLKDVKVVILGQDPYHGDGQAEGLSFSVKPGVDIPPSLVNIYQELHDDLGCYIPNNGYLVKWAEQGVLMLNTYLCIPERKIPLHRALFTPRPLNYRIKAILKALSGNHYCSIVARTRKVLKR